MHSHNSALVPLKKKKIYSLHKTKCSYQKRLTKEKQMQLIKEPTIIIIYHGRFIRQLLDRTSILWKPVSVTPAHRVEHWGYFGGLISLRGDLCCFSLNPHSETVIFQTRCSGEPKHIFVDLATKLLSHYLRFAVVIFRYIRLVFQNKYWNNIKSRCM